MIEKLPKIELHLHLDGSVRTTTVAEILHEDISIVKKNMMCDSKIQSLTDYLTKFELPLQVMQTEENIKRIIKEVLQDLKKEHVIYVEIRFAPQFHQKEGLTQQNVVQYIIEAAKEVSGIKWNLILCCMRGANQEENFETIEVAHTFLNKGVVAIDLAGDEAKYPNDLYKKLFEKAKEYKIPYTIHAGEASNSDSVETAIELGATRIGHGIRAIEKEQILEKLKQKNIILEICPESNVNTKVVLEKKQHPIKELIKKVKVTINTDNRTVSNVTLTKEYEDAMNLFGFTLNDLKRCNLNAVEGAFISTQEKEELKKQIEEEYK